jgi:hypothetical protein
MILAAAVVASTAIWVDPLVILGIIATIITAAAVVVKGIKPFLRRISDFLDDWNGQPGRPGVPKRPGVMERLSTMEDVSTRLSNDVEQIHVRMDKNEQP